MSDLAASMRSDGWHGGPIDVVDLPDGNVLSLDNRRLLAAREAGLDEIPTVRHHPDEPFPPRRGRSPSFTLSDDVYRLPDGSLVRGAEQGGTPVYRADRQPSTWGEAALFRAARQPDAVDGSPFPLSGRIEPPRVR
jgi:hypothetical protein